jgi:hypothetical protein
MSQSQRFLYFQMSEVVENHESPQACGTVDPRLLMDDALVNVAHSVKATL